MPVYKVCVKLNCDHCLTAAGPSPVAVQLTSTGPCGAPPHRPHDKKHGNGKMKHQLALGLSLCHPAKPHGFSGRLSGPFLGAFADRHACLSIPGIRPRLGLLESLTTVATTWEPQPVLPKTVSPHRHNHELRRLTKHYCSSLAASSLYRALESNARPNCLTAKGTLAPSSSAPSSPRSPPPQRCLCPGTRRLGYRGPQVWLASWPMAPCPSVRATLATMSR